MSIVPTDVENAPDHAPNVLREQTSTGIYWPLALLMGSFAATAFVVPLMTPISIHDDWVYARSVEILMRQGKLVNLDVASAVNPFQTLWAGLFAAFFGTHLGVFRLSTFALVMISSPALYGICRELGLNRRVSVLGAAVYLFNPILFSLAYTFMTDAHFVSLLVIASFFYLRGLQRTSGSSIVIGSTVAACAFLVRQHGILIPVGVMTFLLFARRLRFDLKSLLLGLQVWGVPILVMIIYAFWLTLMQGVPGGSRDHAEAFLEAPLGERLSLLWHLTFVTLMYLGWFLVPMAVSIAPRALDLMKSVSSKGVIFSGICLATLFGGLVEFARQGRFMPYLPALDQHAFGPADLIGIRSPLVDYRWLMIFTVVVAMSSMISVLAMAAPWESLEVGRLGAGLLLAVAGWQAVGLFVVSHWFRNDLISIDRYVIVLLPFAICLLLWRIGDLRFARSAAWAVAAVMALLSVAGTRDFLIFHRSIWDLATEAREMGIPDQKLDAGAAWDGYYVSDGTNSVRESRTPNAPWWVVEFAPEIDSTYLISTSPIEGYSEISRFEYSQWLRSEPTYLYLSKRVGAPDPPK